MAEWLERSPCNVRSSARSRVRIQEARPIRNPAGGVMPTVIPIPKPCNVWSSARSRRWWEAVGVHPHREAKGRTCVRSHVRLWTWSASTSPERQPNPTNPILIQLINSHYDDIVKFWWFNSNFYNLLLFRWFNSCYDDLILIMMIFSNFDF